jgi:hypothetical protein
MIIARADFRVAPKIGEAGAIQACRSGVARAREASNRLECLLWVQSRPNWAFRVTSAIPPIATELRTLLEVRLVPILLQKSKVAPVRIFGETLKCEAIDDSDNLSRVIEVAYEFSVRR